MDENALIPIELKTIESALKPCYAVFLRERDVLRMHNFSYNLSGATSASLGHEMEPPSTHALLKKTRSRIGSNKGPLPNLSLSKGIAGLWNAPEGCNWKGDSKPKRHR
jgi:hypothetical protein